MNRYSSDEDSDYGHRKSRRPQRGRSPDDDFENDRPRPPPARSPPPRTHSRKVYKSDSDSDEPRAIKEHRKSHDKDEDLRISYNSTVRSSGNSATSNFTPRTFQKPATGDRPRAATTAWTNPRKDGWAEKENRFSDEESRSQWTRARLADDRRDNASRRNDDDEDDSYGRSKRDWEQNADRGFRGGDRVVSRSDDVSYSTRPKPVGNPHNPPPGAVVSRSRPFDDRKQSAQDEPDARGKVRRSGSDGRGREVEDSGEGEEDRQTRASNDLPRAQAGGRAVGAGRGDNAPRHEQRLRTDRTGANNRLYRSSSGTDNDMGSEESDEEGNDIIKETQDREDREIRHTGGVGLNQGGSVPLVHLCPANGGVTDLVQCLIVREKGSIGALLAPSYKLFLEAQDKLVLIGRKMNMNSTSNYHLFDMTRGTASKKMTKKSGNYLGKLRAADTNRTEYSLVTRTEEREEVAAIIFDRLGLMNQIKEGCQPRKMSVLLPNLSAESEPIPFKVTDPRTGKRKSLVDMLRNGDTGRHFLLASKEPTYENGNYRLNFHGRVSVPSVKNFQLSSPDDPSHIICQFGKIGEDRFHLDYKAPLNAFQAFSLALCHFDT